jgi:hypothetical protein
MQNADWASLETIRHGIVLTRRERNLITAQRCPIRSIRRILGIPNQLKTHFYDAGPLAKGLFLFWDLC